MVSYWADCRNIHFSIERVTFQLHNSWMGSDTVLGVISVAKREGRDELALFHRSNGPNGRIGNLQSTGSASFPSPLCC